MADSLAEAVNKLRHSSARLNQLTDEANMIVKEVENFLNKECSVGVFARVVVSTMEVAEQSLQYRRVGSRYRIAVVWVTEGGDPDDPDISVRPWSECPRDEKLETIKSLPSLIVEIAKNLDKKIIDTEKAASTVSQVLRTLQHKKED